MKFAFKLWGGNLKTMLASTYRMIIPLALINTILAVATAFTDSSIKNAVTYIVIRTIVGVIVCVMFDVVISIVLTTKNYKANKALNDYGFSPEYLRIFEQEYIVGKPQNNMISLQYAEGLTQIGETQAAINVLNSLKIDQSRINDRAAYLFVYMMTAIKMGDTALADDIWLTNQQFLDSCIGKPLTQSVSQLMYIAFITVDAAAERYERALKTANDFLASKYATKRNSTDFYILLAYIYGKLGNENMKESCAKEATALLNSGAIIFEAIRVKTEQELAKALRGEFPI